LIDPTVQVTRPRGGVAVVTLNGEHDITSRDQYQALFEQLLRENDLVVVDVSKAQFIDSSFIHTLFLSSQSARGKGKAFRLQTGTAPIVHRVLEISGALDVVEVAHSREEALRA
jgi:anti-anti-sigma factor